MGKCTFQSRWLIDYDWLSPVKGDKYKAYCKCCKTEFNVSSMGHTAVKSHGDPARVNSRHNTNVKIWRAQRDCTSLCLRTPSRSDDKDDVKPIVVDPGSSLEAEIRWVLKLVYCGYSFNSSANAGELFSIMFDDSEKARNFTCGSDKAAYVVKFGLAPYFISLFTDYLKSDTFPYVFMFDESYCPITQSKQLDVHIRFWDTSKECVSVRYLCSKFIGHGRATNLLEEFYECCKRLRISQIMQIGMDGPSANWLFYKKIIDKEFSSLDKPGLINCGSCGLHNIHGSFKHGIEALSWELDSFFKSLFRLLDKAPARREDYIEASKQSVFPLKFCKCRWVENLSVAERSLEIIPNMHKWFIFMKDNKTFPKGKETITLHEDATIIKTNVTTKTVYNFINDPLIYAKINFFMLIAKIFEKFLVKYQASRPMVPFLHKDLEMILRNLLKRLVKRSILDEKETVNQLLQIDLDDDDNLLSHKNIDVGIKTNQELKRLLALNKVSDLQVRQFKMDCKCCLKVSLKHFIEKSPAKYSLVINARCFDPNFIASYPDEARKSLVRVLEILCKARRLDIDSEDILQEYDNFIEEFVKPNMNIFKCFDSCDKNSPLDAFYGGYILHMPLYKHIWYIIKLILTLSHGQRDVESGFSLNKYQLKTNQTEITIEARRIVHDQISYDGGVLKVDLTRGLKMSVKAARSRYRAHLEGESNTNKSNKRTVMMVELEDLHSELKGKQIEVNTCETEATNLLEIAVECSATECKVKLIQSKALTKKASDLKAEITQISSKIDEKQKAIRSICL